MCWCLKCACYVVFALDALRVVVLFWVVGSPRGGLCADFADLCWLKAISGFRG